MNREKGESNRMRKPLIAIIDTVLRCQYVYINRMKVAINP